LQGRTFSETDTETAPKVGMINARLAREYFPNGDAVGKRFMFGHPSATSPAVWINIVGVVGDTKLYGLENPSRLEIYVPFRQSPVSHMSLIVKSAVEPAALISAIRGE